MARYLDTGAGAADQCLGAWLEREVIVGIRAFRAQLGFFSYGALESFAPTLRKTGESGSPIRLVVGSNNGSLSQIDLTRTWSIFDGLPDGRLTVVAYSNAMFHPKVVHVVRHDKSETAIIGSGNLTDRGLAWNVEASISLDTRDGDQANLVREIAAAVDRWHTCADEGVYLISSADDVRRLTAAELIDLPQPSYPRLPEPTQTRRALKAGRRSRLWRPATASRPPVRPSLTSQRAAALGASAAAVVPSRWCKQLSESDAQRVKGNPTGKLRLSQSRHPIDHKKFFREQFFRPAVWTTDVRTGGKIYEVADVDFAVKIHGRSYRVQTLRVDHGLHRVAGQGNVPTVLAWGPVLGKELRSRSYVGSWVVIERRTDGTFALRIERHKPAWAP